MPAALAEKITPLVITFNEAPNIERTLDKLRWARRVVVLDSGSTDETLEIAKRYPNVDVLFRPFDSFAKQCNWGLSQITSEWVLSMDADYELSDALIEEIGRLRDDGTDGYLANFVYRIYGRPLRGTLYPARLALYRREGAQYRDEGHAHRLERPGRVTPLRGHIYHDDRKPLARWIGSQIRYAKNEADYLLTTPTNMLSRTDRLRRMAWPLPLLVLPYTLLWKRCLLDGRAGWYYAVQRFAAEALICLELVDRRLQGSVSSGSSRG
jgi:glycosyltransferase involved in cell wall biosynthesis